MLFLCFPMPVISQGKIVKNATTRHSAQSFALFEMASSKNNFHKAFKGLKNTHFSILEFSPSKSINEILLYGALDRVFHWLFKSLFRCRQQTVFNKKIHKIKGALNFCPPLYVSLEKHTIPKDAAWKALQVAKCNLFS